MTDEQPRDSDREPGREPEGGGPAAPPEDAAAAGLDRGAEGDDAERLKVLEELYSALESELEGDLDQEEPPGR